ncbi:PLD nuclease N-terminal domain-containing protein [Rhodococcus sp. C3V]|uniref:PLD nuclease N-terminal domain-containing protein n=1 Tax=Rhodococcus sp. C3V TaxID=3034165 RepID=UPI0023E1A072|nr:PLD nuclease N-terminal domain-containing protein [Rhodococcus sp. C3V]MDF3316395.1 PLD nuclease N-terminal domain-containing protein [Rhodococcus sp. C3V]
MPLFVFSLVTIALWTFCLVDVVTRDVRYIQHLPKTLWMVVILFVPMLGSVLWLVAGRGQSASPDYASVAAHVDDEGRRTVAAHDPAAEEAFRRECRERAEQQRRVGRRQRTDGDPGQI